ncbi:hypothetical protein Zmor_014183 [Zophobas morio]|uniref:FZ domain-containing protein n=1 Tax=Zophobas morio TaxID=2755281 RepID=A0AA38IHB5_9CUCU|nr:hypothetical protein Zmor_014183 [Zophobas morio]
MMWLIILTLFYNMCNVEIIATNTDRSSYGETMHPRQVTECKEITIPMCSYNNIPYRMTKMPNLLGHTTQQKAAWEVHQFRPLIAINCSPELRLFLCSVYFPKCTTEKELIPPCRSLCNSAKSGCEGIMNKYGHVWPSRLSCQKYSENVNNCLNSENTSVILNDTLY